MHYARLKQSKMKKWVQRNDFLYMMGKNVILDPKCDVIGGIKI